MKTFIICISVLLLIILISFLKFSNKKLSTKEMSYCAICVALAFILSNITLFRMPQGGSITLCSMLVLSLIGYLFGIKAGIIGSLAFGLLNFIMDAYVINPIQGFLDYFLAYMCLGLSGIFKDKKFGLYYGFILGCVLRFLVSTLSGYIFFSTLSTTIDNLKFSVVYNATYISVEMILSLIVISIPQVYKSIERIKKSLLK